MSSAYRAIIAGRAVAISVVGVNPKLALDALHRSSGFTSWLATNRQQAEISESNYAGRTYKLVVPASNDTPRIDLSVRWVMFESFERLEISGQQQDKRKEIFKLGELYGWFIVLHSDNRIMATPMVTLNELAAAETWHIDAQTGWPDTRENRGFSNAEKTIFTHRRQCFQYRPEPGPGNGAEWQRRANSVICAPIKFGAPGDEPFTAPGSNISGMPTHHMSVIFNSDWGKGALKDEGGTRVRSYETPANPYFIQATAALAGYDTIVCCNTSFSYSVADDHGEWIKSTDNYWNVKYPLVSGPLIVVATTYGSATALMSNASQSPEAPEPQDPDHIIQVASVLDSYINIEEINADGSRIEDFFGDPPENLGLGAVLSPGGFKRNVNVVAKLEQNNSGGFPFDRITLHEMSTMQLRDSGTQPALDGRVLNNTTDDTNGYGWLGVPPGWSGWYPTNATGRVLIHTLTSITDGELPSSELFSVFFKNRGGEGPGNDEFPNWRLVYTIKGITRERTFESGRVPTEPPFQGINSPVVEAFAQISNGVHNLQGYAVNLDPTPYVTDLGASARFTPLKAPEETYLFLDGNDVTNLLAGMCGCQPQDIQFAFMDVPHEALFREDAVDNRQRTEAA